MFSLDTHAAKILAVTLRAEHHGEELVNAVTVKVELTCSNDVLSEFDPHLKGALFKKPDVVDAKHADLLPIVRFPLLGPIKWGYEGLGYTARVRQSDDLFEGDPIELKDCRIDAFQIECRDNGIVGLKFNIAARPMAEALGKLALLLQREVEITLEEPSADESRKDEAA